MHKFTVEWHKTERGTTRYAVDTLPEGWDTWSEYQKMDWLDDNGNPKDKTDRSDYTSDLYVG